MAALCFNLPGLVLAQEERANIIPETSEITVIPNTNRKSAEFASPDSVVKKPGSENIPFFGYDFFQFSLSTLDLKTVGLIPDDYILGPGDRIGIYLLGKAQEQFDVTVGVEGKIMIPTVGIIAVQDMQLGQFRNRLNQILEQFYRNFTLEVLVLTPKTIRVDVVGEVNAPGRYALSSMNNVLDAILRARGPKYRGSLRNIEIYRDNARFTQVDIYDFLLNRDSRDRLYLRNGDRIHVPLVQARVTVTGEVRRPAHYELNPLRQETFADAIAMAGGLTDYANPDKIELSRVTASGTRMVQYQSYPPADANDSTKSAWLLKNDDHIRVFSKLDLLNRDIVAIYGAVKRPGEYEWAENLHLSDLLLKAGYFTRSAYRLQAEVAKIDPKTPSKILTVDLPRLFDEPNGSADVVLEPDDKVFIREIPEWQVGPMVEVKGEAKFPGFYPINEDTTRLSQVMAMAGGFTEKAFLREATLTRQHNRMATDREFERLKSMTRDEMSNHEYEYLVMKLNAEQRNQIVVDFRKLFVEKQGHEDVVLRANDIISIPKLPAVVDVTGRVGQPGGVVFENNASLKYYIHKAGGFAWDADKRRTKVIKANGQVLDDEDVKKLEPGDQIWVPRKPERNYWNILQQSVMVSAQIATIFLVIQNARN